MIKKVLFLAFLAISLGTSACSVAAQDSNTVSKESNEEFTVGTWRLDGELPPNNTGHGFHWFLEYTFNADGTFILNGYPPLMQKGKYRIVKSEDAKLTLELYEQSGNFGTKDKTIEIQVDRKKGILNIDGKEGFRRTKNLVTKA
jgi:hypothetical protein